jgi:spermidine synthase
MTNNIKWEECLAEEEKKILIEQYTTDDGVLLQFLHSPNDFYIYADEEELMSKVSAFSAELMVDFGCDSQKENQLILIGGLGMGFTLKRAIELLPPCSKIIVAEKYSKIVEWNRKYLMHLNGKYLDDPRVEIYIGDVSDLITEEQTFDSILMDVDNGPNEEVLQNHNFNFYKIESVSKFFNSLNNDGTIVYWAAGYPDEFISVVKDNFKNTKIISKKVFSDEDSPHMHTLIKINK